MAEEFTCAVDEKYRSACKDLPQYSGSRYCVLHDPSMDKDLAEFTKAIEKKLKDKDFDFRGVYFPGKQNFASLLPNATFEGTVNFSEANFGGMADFNGVTFEGRVDFSKATFEGVGTFERISYGGPTFEVVADFRSATFEGKATFTEATFTEGRANFVETTFKGGAEFSKVYFVEGAFFDDATFETEADFGSATFAGSGASFFSAAFELGASFSEATFEREAFFEKATFKKEGAQFQGATFKGVAYFSEANFEEGAYFGNATFKEMAYFGDTVGKGPTFGAIASFHGATFERKAHFREVIFKEEADFSETNFPEGATFRSLQESSTRTFLTFEAAVIEKPERLSFHSTDLRPSWFINVDAQKFDFTDVRWKGTLDEEINALKVREIESLHTLLSQACQRLAANAEVNGDYPLANNFYYWSMKALRKAGWRRLGLIRTIYGLLSGYGVKAGRAFGVLVVIWLVFAALYVLVPSSAKFNVSFSEFHDFSPSDSEPIISDVGKAMVYSLGAMARLSPEPKPGPGWFQFLVTVEGLLGPLQIGLLLLAIRRQVMR